MAKLPLPQPPMSCEAVRASAIREHGRARGVTLQCQLPLRSAAHPDAQRDLAAGLGERLRNCPAEALPDHTQQWVKANCALRTCILCEGCADHGLPPANAHLIVGNASNERLLACMHATRDGCPLKAAPPCVRPRELHGLLGLPRRSMFRPGPLTAATLTLRARLLPVLAATRRWTIARREAVWLLPGTTGPVNAIRWTLSAGSIASALREATAEEREARITAAILLCASQQ